MRLARWVHSHSSRWATAQLPPSWRSGTRRLCAVPAGITAETTNPSPARTEVVDWVSPPDVVQAKAQQLQGIGPGGWPKAAAYVAVSLPLWLLNALSLAAKYATKPQQLLASPDPNAFSLEPPFPLEEEWIPVNGIRLHAVSPGRQRNKPLMLLLHGFPECWYSWRHQMAAFARDYDVVALDLRGYNTSDKPKGVDSYHLRHLAADVKAAVAALGHQSCTLVAHDWGGMVAWTAAGLYGRDLVRRLVVMGLPHNGIAMTNMTGEQYKRSLYMMSFQAPLIPELQLTADNAAALDAAFASPPMGVKNPGALTPADLAWFRAAFCQPGAATAALNYYRSFVRFSVLSDPQDPVWGALRRPLDMPVLMLYGGDDAALGTPLLAGTEAAIPQGTIKVLRNCSHWVQQDYPVQVNELVQEWLKEQDLQASSSSSAPAAAPAGTGAAAA